MWVKALADVPVSGDGIKVKRSFILQNLQSTNWQTMRFKPPPPDSTIGWRVEFRPMEVSQSSFFSPLVAVLDALEFPDPNDGL